MAAGKKVLIYGGRLCTRQGCGNRYPVGCRNSSSEKSGRVVFTPIWNSFTGEYGYFREALISLVKKEKRSPGNRTDHEKATRATSKNIAGSPVVVMEDYQASEIHDFKNHTSAAIEIPKSNVLIFTRRMGRRLLLGLAERSPKSNFTSVWMARIAKFWKRRSMPFGKTLIWIHELFPKNIPVCKTYRLYAVLNIVSNVFYALLVRWRLLPSFPCWTFYSKRIWRLLPWKPVYEGMGTASNLITSNTCPIKYTTMPKTTPPRLSYW